MNNNILELQKELHNKDVKQTDLIQKQIDLAILQAQINPHFLYNTLEAIRSQAEIDDQEEIARATEALGNYFRYCINSHGEPVHLFEELQNIQDYYHLVRFRFFDRITLDIDVEDPSILQTFLPRMTLQPIAENAISHGLKNKIRDAQIRIHATRSDDLIYLAISDNGCGMDSQQLEKLLDHISNSTTLLLKPGQRHGIALPNVHHRLQLLFGPSYGLSIKSFPGEGTDVLITYPVDFSNTLKEQNERIY
nr:histidine kinase [uncultured Blautia sp.]